MLNHTLALQGRLTRDPQSTGTQSGTPVCSFFRCVVRKVQGNQVQTVSEFRSAWRNRRNGQQILFQGQGEIIVEGSRTREWTDGRRKLSAPQMRWLLIASIPAAAREILHRPDMPCRCPQDEYTEIALLASCRSDTAGQIKERIRRRKKLSLRLPPELRRIYSMPQVP